MVCYQYTNLLKKMTPTSSHYGGYFPEQYDGYGGNQYDTGQHNNLQPQSPYPQSLEVPPSPSNYSVGSPTSETGLIPDVSPGRQRYPHSYQARLMATWGGSLSGNSVMAATNLLVSMIATAITHADYASSAQQTAVSSSYQTLAGLAFGAGTSAIMHRLSRGNQAEETQHQMMAKVGIISNAMTLYGGGLTGIAYDVASAATLHQSINNERLKELIVEQLLSNLTAQGILAAGGYALYRRTSVFKRVVDDIIGNAISHVQHYLDRPQPPAIKEPGPTSTKEDGKNYELEKMPYQYR